MICIECGRHHAQIQCTRSSKCGVCGNDWPCDEHKLLREPRRGAQLNFDCDNFPNKGTRDCT